MPRLARVLGAAALLAAGLVLPTGPAQAAACSGSTGVTVVIDYGSSSSTLCAPDAASAGAVLDSVSDVGYVPMYGDGVVCKINGVPSNQTCQRMPPSSAYWAFWTAQRGGSWTYSSSGVAEYDPPPGTVIGFAFGAGAKPSTPPPAPSAAPKPSPKPTPKPTPRTSSSSTPRPAPTPTVATPSPKASASTPRPGGSSATSPSSSATGRSATTTARPSGTTTSPGPTTTTTTTTPGSSTPGSDAATTDGGTAVASAARADEGSRVTLLAGLGLVGLVGAAAAYVALRRRAGG